MPASFLHGVEVLEIDAGPRPIQTVRSSVIGIVGTAPDADATAFPLDTPVLVAGSRVEAAKLDTVGTGLGTLPAALDGIFDQAGALVVVVRVAEGVDAAATQTNVIGGVDAAIGAYTGVHALAAAESVLGVAPKILIAPGFTNAAPVVGEMQSIADRLRAVIIADGLNINDIAGIGYKAVIANPRVYLVDPWVRVWDTATSSEVTEPPSARVAGVIAKSDAERGFWWSPSNRPIYGITGTTRPVDFTLGDATARANVLNENDVATIIQKDGFRLWGNRGTSAVDPKWMYLSVRRTADMINESLLRAHLWAVDRNITKTYIADVLEGVNGYLRHLVAQGAILGGTAYADPDLNTAAAIQAGQVYFDFDFTPPYPAEHITFQSHLVNDYIEEILPA